MELSLFAKYQTAEPFIDKAVSRKTERGLLLEELTQGVNDERKGTKYHPLTLRAIAVKVGHLKTVSDLHFLLSICKSEKLRGGSFGKTFFGSLKVHENRPT